MPTALELTPEEWRPYIEAARQRLALPQPTSTEQQQREQLLVRIRHASTILKDHFGARRVILFGSLADVDWFSLDSDVDLAVEGLSAEAYWHAWRVVEDIISDRPVDLIELETAKVSLLRAIHEYGIEL